jgi:hypothetical protein
MRSRRAGGEKSGRTVERLTHSNACLSKPAVSSSRDSDFPSPRCGRWGREQEIVHYFPLLQRDTAGPTVHDFRPERWLATQPVLAGGINLFSRPSCLPWNEPDPLRACSHCTSARQHKITVRSERLSRDRSRCRSRAGRASCWSSHGAGPA